jgi:hypothetical protein
MLQSKHWWMDDTHCPECEVTVVEYVGLGLPILFILLIHVHAGYLMFFSPNDSFFLVSCLFRKLNSQKAYISESRYTLRPLLLVLI